jgi:hypothetical protein
VAPQQSLAEGAERPSGLNGFVTEFSEVEIQSGAEFHGRSHTIPCGGSARISGEAAAQGQEKQGLVVTKDLFHWQGNVKNRSSWKLLFYRQAQAGT